MPKSGSTLDATSSLVLIRNVNIIHPEKTQGAISQPNATIVIRGSRIDSIDSADSTTLQRDEVVIDGTKKWLLPGFIDTHIHFSQSGNPYTRPDVLDLTRLVPLRAGGRTKPCSSVRDPSYLARFRSYERHGHGWPILEFCRKRGG